MTRQTMATSGSPAGASGMNALPTAERSIAAIATRRCPSVRRARRDDRADERADPAHARDEAERRPGSAELVEDEQEERRPEDAPQAASAIAHRRTPGGSGRGATSRRPSRISSRTGSRSAARRRRRLLAADRAEEDGRARNDSASTAIAIGAVSTWTRKPLIPKAMNSAAEPLAARRRVGRDQLVALDDRRQVGVVGRVEERRQDRGQAGHDQELPERQDARARTATGIEPSRAARPRSAEIRTGRRRSRSTQAPATRPNSSAGDELEAAQDRDLDRARAEDEDRRERQRGPRDERAEDRDRRGASRPGRRPGCARSSRRGERVAHDGGA